MRAISIVGTGYVGLSTAVCFASRGYHVIASTHNKEKVATINAKRAPFYEPRLDEMLKESVESQTLRVVDTRDEAVLQTDVTFLTVGTPQTTDGRMDLRHVVRACEEVGRALKKKNTYHLVFVPYFGIIAAALTTLLGYGFIFVVTAIYSVRHMTLDVDFGFILKSIFASIVISPFVLAWHASGLLSISVLIVICAVVYTAILFVLKGFTASEIRFFSGFLAGQR